MAQQYCHLDFETYSPADLRTVGAFKYAEHPDTEVLICCYQIDNQKVRTWLPRVKPMPRDLLEAAQDENIVFVAHNAEFERAIWHDALRRQAQTPGAAWPTVSVNRWYCTAVACAVHGLPRSLEGAGAALGLKQQKSDSGKALIRIFCMPRKASRANPAIRTLPEDRPDIFAEFVAYCQQDVRSEHAIFTTLPRLTNKELKNWHHSCVINERGIPFDLGAVRKTLPVVRALTYDMVREARTLTGGIKPTQRDKFLYWLRENGCELNNLKAERVEAALKQDIPAPARRALELRQELGKAAPKKLDAMMKVVCNDGRARGTIFFYGAHTGRNSGKLVQPHNFKRGLLPVEEQLLVLRIFRTGDPELTRMLLSPDALDKLSQVMRGFIRAPDGMRFLVGDYAAIEARGLAWVADERHVLKQYVDGVDTYKAMAAKLYGIPIEDVDKEQRRIGKQLRLGAGYQLGPPKFVSYCDNNGIAITDDFAEEAIAVYREDNPRTVALWSLMGTTAIDAVESGRGIWEVRTGSPNCTIAFEKWQRWLLMHLPGGRRLHYFDPQVDTVVKWGRPMSSLSYQGKTKIGWGRVTTYGGKLTENAIQGISRDVLVHGMHQAEIAGFPVVLNVHDEIVSLVTNTGPWTHEHLCYAMSQMPAWARGFPINAEGFECVYYRKG